MSLLLKKPVRSRLGMRGIESMLSPPVRRLSVITKANWDLAKSVVNNDDVTLLSQLQPDLLLGFKHVMKIATGKDELSMPDSGRIRQTIFSDVEALTRPNMWVIADVKSTPSTPTSSPSSSSKSSPLVIPINIVNDYWSENGGATAVASNEAAICPLHVPESVESSPLPTTELTESSNAIMSFTLGISTVRQRATSLITTESVHDRSYQTPAAVAAQANEVSPESSSSIGATSAASLPILCIEQNADTYPETPETGSFPPTPEVPITDGSSFEMLPLPGGNIAGDEDAMTPLRQALEALMGEPGMIPASTQSMSDMGPTPRQSSPTLQTPDPKVPATLSTVRSKVPPVAPVHRCRWLDPSALVEIPRCDVIGEGAFSTVTAMQYDGKNVVLKIFKEMFGNELDGVLHEAGTASYMGVHGIGPIVVGLLPPNSHHHLPTIVFEHITNAMDMFNLFTTCKSLVCSEVLDILIQTVRLLAAIHQRGFVHNDVKINNFLVVPNQLQEDLSICEPTPPMGATGKLTGSSRYRVYLIDFGQTTFSHCATNSMTEEASRFVESNLQQEVEDQSVKSVTSDVYQFGIFISMITNIMGKSALGAELIPLANQCWEAEPADRPSMECLEEKFAALKSKFKPKKLAAPKHRNCAPGHSSSDLSSSGPEDSSILFLNKFTETFINPISSSSSEAYLGIRITPRILPLPRTIVCDTTSDETSESSLEMPFVPGELEPPSGSSEDTSSSFEVIPDTAGETSASEDSDSSFPSYQGNADNVPCNQNEANEENDYEEKKEVDDDEAFCIDEDLFVAGFISDQSVNRQIVDRPTTVSADVATQKFLFAASSEPAVVYQATNIRPTRNDPRRVCSDQTLRLEVCQISQDANSSLIVMCSETSFRSQALSPPPSMDAINQLSLLQVCAQIAATPDSRFGSLSQALALPTAPPVSINSSPLLAHFSHPAFGTYLTRRCSDDNLALPTVTSGDDDGDDVFVSWQKVFCRSTVEVPTQCTWRWLEPASMLPAQITPIDAISQGTFSWVYRMKYRNTNVIVKVYKDNNQSDMEVVIREADTANMLSIYGVGPPMLGMLLHGPGSLLPAIVMEALPGAQDLYSLIKDRHIITRMDLLEVLLQAARLLSFLHQRDFIHNDVKLTNILVVPNNGEHQFPYPPPEGATGVCTSHCTFRVFLIDFGQTTFERGALFHLSEEDMVLFRQYPYLPPEVVSGEPTASTTDVYSFGMAMQMVIQMLNTNAMAWELQNLINQCLIKDKARRPTMEEIEYSLRRRLGSTFVMGPIFPDSDSDTDSEDGNDDDNDDDSNDYNDDTDTDDGTDSDGPVGPLDYSRQAGEGAAELQAIVIGAPVVGSGGESNMTLENPLRLEPTNPQPIIPITPVQLHRRSHHIPRYFSSILAMHGSVSTSSSLSSISDKSEEHWFSADEEVD